MYVSRAWKPAVQAEGCLDGGGAGGWLDGGGAGGYLDGGRAGGYLDGGRAGGYLDGGRKGWGLFWFKVIVPIMIFFGKRSTLLFKICHLDSIWISNVFNWAQCLEFSHPPSFNLCTHAQFESAMFSGVWIIKIRHQQLVGLVQVPYIIRRESALLFKICHLNSEVRDVPHGNASMACFTNTLKNERQILFLLYIQDNTCRPYDWVLSILLR